MSSSAMREYVNLISIFKQFYTSVKNILSLKGRLGTRL